MKVTKKRIVAILLFSVAFKTHAMRLSLFLILKGIQLIKVDSELLLKGEIYVKIVFRQKQ